jgi:hypothetical protein
MFVFLLSVMDVHNAAMETLYKRHVLLYRWTFPALSSGKCHPFWERLCRGVLRPCHSD